MLTVGKTEDGPATFLFFITTNRLVLHLILQTLCQIKSFYLKLHYFKLSGNINSSSEMLANIIILVITNCSFIILFYFISVIQYYQIHIYACFGISNSSTTTIIIIKIFCLYRNNGAHLSRGKVCRFFGGFLNIFDFIISFIDSFA